MHDTTDNINKLKNVLKTKQYWQDIYKHIHQIKELNYILPN